MLAVVLRNIINENPTFLLQLSNCNDIIKSLYNWYSDSIAI